MSAIVFEVVPMSASTTQACIGGHFGFLSGQAVVASTITVKAKNRFERIITLESPYLVSTVNEIIELTINTTTKSEISDQSDFWMITFDGNIEFYRNDLPVRRAETSENA